MIAWSIQAALESGLFERVIVSTDDAEIAAVSKSYGAEVPFTRPEHLSDDQSGTSAVIAHAIGWCREQGMHPDPVCCIYATAPFVQTEDLRRGWELLVDKDADFSFSVTSYPYPIQRAIKLNANGGMEMFQPENFLIRSQDLEEAFHDAGQFYWGRSDAWCSEKAIFGKSSTPVILPRQRVQDIDTTEDWENAELMFRAIRNHE